MTAGIVVHGSTLSFRVVGTSFSDTTIGLGDGLRPQEIVGQQFLEYFSAPVRALSGWWTPPSFTRTIVAEDDIAIMPRE